MEAESETETEAESETERETEAGTAATARYEGRHSRPDRVAQAGSNLAK